MLLLSKGDNDLNPFIWFPSYLDFLLLTGLIQLCHIIESCIIIFFRSETNELGIVPNVFSKMRQYSIGNFKNITVSFV